LVDNCKEAAFQDIEVAYTVAALKEMSLNQFELLESAHLCLYDLEWYKTILLGEIEVEACLSLMLKRGATEQDVKSLEASRLRKKCGGIEVEIYWEGNSWGAVRGLSYDELQCSNSEEKSSESSKDDHENEDQILCL